MRRGLQIGEEAGNLQESTVSFPANNDRMLGRGRGGNSLSFLSAYDMHKISLCIHM